LLGLAVHFHFDGRVAVGGPHHFVRDAFDFFLHFIKFPPHEPLDRINRVAGVGDGLPFGGLAHQAVAGFGEGNHRRSRAFAFGVLEHDRLAAFNDRHAGVCGSQIYAKYFSHIIV